MVALDSLRETKCAQQRPEVLEADVCIRSATEHLNKNPLAHRPIIAAAARLTGIVWAALSGAR